MPDAATLSLLERDPPAAAAALGPHAGASGASPSRLAYELARFVAARTPGRWADHLRASGVETTEPEVATALLALAEAATNAGAAGTAIHAYATWLGDQPNGPALPARARALSVRLYRLLLQGELGTDDLVRTTLQHDPEHAELAREAMDAMLADDILALLEQHRTTSWAPQAAHDLPQRATVGDLRDAATVERMATAMEELAGIPRTRARAQLRATLESFDD